MGLFLFIIFLYALSKCWILLYGASTLYILPAEPYGKMDEIHRIMTVDINR